MPHILEDLIGKPGIYVAGLGDGDTSYISQEELSASSMPFTIDSVHILGTIAKINGGEKRYYEAWKWRHYYSESISRVVIEGANLSSGGDEADNQYYVIYYNQIKGYDATNDYYVISGALPGGETTGSSGASTGDMETWFAGRVFSIIISG